MKLTHRSRRIGLACWLAVGLLCGMSSGLAAKESPPQVSAEGMQLQKNGDARLVYLKPGASFEKYDRVAILDTHVEFAKDWQREYNQNATGLQGRVSTQDMDRMKAAVAAEFKKVFTQELQADGGYEVVDSAAPDVLVLRPAIIDLQVTAPDLASSNMRRTLVRSAGQMTLFLELWDSSSNTILARIMDPQQDPGRGGQPMQASRASNMMAMEKILEDWAVKLRKHLDAARGKTSGS